VVERIRHIGPAGVDLEALEAVVEDGVSHFFSIVGGSPHRSVIQARGKGKVESEVFSNWAAIETDGKACPPPGVTYWENSLTHSEAISGPE
jgi:hypothetical protein